MSYLKIEIGDDETGVTAEETFRDKDEVALFGRESKAFAEVVARLIRDLERRR